MLHRVLAPAVLFLVALSLAACGGKGDDSAGALPPGAVLDRIDLASTLQSVQTLSSFRFDFTMKLEVQSKGSSGAGGNPAADAFAQALMQGLRDVKGGGAVAGPDQFEVSLSAMGQEVGFVQIGDKAWVKAGKGWVPSGTAGLGTVRPQDIAAGLIPDQVLKVAKTSREKMNGVETIRYSFDKKALQQLAQDLHETVDVASVDQADVDVWLNADNIPVRVAMKFAGEDEDGSKVSLTLELNLKDINDPSIQIKAPV